jgi:hypothetical protein
VKNRFASSRPNGAGGDRSTKCDKQAAKPLTNTRWLGDRRANESVEADRTAVGETRDSTDGVMGGDLHEGVPVSEHFE